MEEKFVINLKGLQKKSSENSTKIPDDYSEIIPKYISIYTGCWVKYSNVESGLAYPGGYLIHIEDGVATIRNIRRDIFEKKISEHIFYCKTDTPNHKAVKAIIEEKDRLSLKVEEFNVEKQKFLEKRKKLFF
jgi:hypothetical protein